MGGGGGGGIVGGLGGGRLGPAMGGCGVVGWGRFGSGDGRGGGWVV